MTAIHVTVSEDKPQTAESHLPQQKKKAAARVFTQPDLCPFFHAEILECAFKCKMRLVKAIKM